MATFNDSLCGLICQAHVSVEKTFIPQIPFYQAGGYPGTDIVEHGGGATP